MNTYEVLNPHDEVLFDAPSDKVAALAVIICSEGRWGVALGQRRVLPVMMFYDEQATAEALAKVGIDLHSLASAVRESWPQIVAALNSARIASGSATSLVDVCELMRNTVELVEYAAQNESAKERTIT